MRYVVSRMDVPQVMKEASAKAIALEYYKRAVAATPGASIRLLDRQAHRVLAQNYGDKT